MNTEMKKETVAVNLSGGWHAILTLGILRIRRITMRIIYILPSERMLLRLFINRTGLLMKHRRPWQAGRRGCVLWQVGELAVVKHTFYLCHIRNNHLILEASLINWMILNMLLWNILFIGNTTDIKLLTTNVGEEEISDNIFLLFSVNDKHCRQLFVHPYYASSI